MKQLLSDSSQCTLDFVSIIDGGVVALAIIAREWQQIPRSHEPVIGGGADDVTSRNRTICSWTSN
jgi:hypothetical protein